MDKHTEDFLQFCEDSERELAQEIERQEGFIKALEIAVLEIIRSIHSDYDNVPERIQKLIEKELHQYIVEINEYLDYNVTGYIPVVSHSIEIPPVREIDEDRILLKKCYEKSKELVIAYFPEVYDANGEVLRMIDLSCFVAMAEFETGFNFLCVDYLEAFVDTEEI